MMVLMREQGAKVGVSKIWGPFGPKLFAGSALVMCWTADLDARCADVQ